MFSLGFPFEIYITQQRPRMCFANILPYYKFCINNDKVLKILNKIMLERISKGMYHVKQRQWN